MSPLAAARRVSARNSVSPGRTRWASGRAPRSGSAVARFGRPVSRPAAASPARPPKTGERFGRARGARPASAAAARAAKGPFPEWLRQFTAFNYLDAVFA